MSAVEVLSKFQATFNEGNIEGLRAFFDDSLTFTGPAGNFNGPDAAINQLKEASGKIGTKNCTLQTPTGSGNSATASFTFKKMMMTFTIRDTIEVNDAGKIVKLTREKL
eukprot:TRINITY_DN276_c0_g1::TRINITY_DN276_c0_g1_i1::g.1699::m.1699 TRINITY_DN276_c0_g1::TRINITY_DN276_c0_g1_i1::g.1699  ORF type:complete len:124 (+),score=62.79,SnoaL_2/PF12680.2/1.3e-09,DUF4440/PF14534.1/2e-05,DUF4440/PF14534.1/2.7e+03,SnoaL_3/PF13474.1/0.00046 TRINITY_DN276_c0_g1_i1:47-373(+)